MNPLRHSTLKRQLNKLLLKKARSYTVPFLYIWTARRARHFAKQNASEPQVRDMNYIMLTRRFAEVGKKTEIEKAASSPRKGR